MIFLSTRLGPVRAYDVKGRRIEEHSYNSTSTQGDVTRRMLANIKKNRKARQSEKAKNTSVIQDKKDFAKSETMEFSDDVVDRFFLSILDGDMETVQGFLDAGMSPNVKRPRLGHSPLFTAVMGHHDKIALMFIKIGGDVNFKDENGSTPLMWAVRDCKSVPLVNALVTTGADVNARAKGGGTPLM